MEYTKNIRLTFVCVVLQRQEKKSDTMLKLNTARQKNFGRKKMNKIMKLCTNQATPTG